MGREDCGSQVLVVDSVTKLNDSHRGNVVVAGSHGGIYAAYVAAQTQLRGVVLHDAGLGLDRAGIAGLEYLDQLGMPAAAIGYLSARIGDGSDMAGRGIVSFVNRSASAFGCKVGQACLDSANLMLSSPPLDATPPPYEESRFLLRRAPGEADVWGVDSNSMVKATDKGAIVVTGSHGGLLGGRPESAISVAVLAAVYHDAGIGIDNAGISRLAAMETRGIIAATVAGETARVGDARSVWGTGRLSAFNQAAERCGARLGMSVPEFVEAILAPGHRAKV